MSKNIILMSTYNGHKFLDEQLKSLENQTYKDWDIMIRDDNSTDNTRNILFEYKKKSNHNVEIIYEGVNIGPSLSFLKLLKNAVKKDYDHFFFCDQDDVWLPQKMEHSLRKLKDVIDTIGRQPVLIHTDLRVVNNGLSTIYNSMWQAHHSCPSHNQVSNYLVENNVTGCTVLINKLAADLVCKITDSINERNIVMHDWWIALIIALFGKVDFIDESTILYRQHAQNVIGLNKKNLIASLNKKTFTEKSLMIKKVIKQSGELSNYLLKNNLKMQPYDLINKYSRLSHLSLFERRKLIKKYKIEKTDFIKNIVFQLMILTIR